MMDNRNVKVMKDSNVELYSIKIMLTPQKEIIYSITSSPVVDEFRASNPLAYSGVEDMLNYNIEQTLFDYEWHCEIMREDI